MTPESNKTKPLTTELKIYYRKFLEDCLVQILEKYVKDQIYNLLFNQKNIYIFSPFMLKTSDFSSIPPSFVTLQE